MDAFRFTQVYNLSLLSYVEDRNGIIGMIIVFSQSGRKIPANIWEKRLQRFANERAATIHSDYKNEKNPHVRRLSSFGRGLHYLTNHPAIR